MTMHVDSMAKGRGSAILQVHVLDGAVGVVATENGREAGVVLADKASIKHLIGLMKHAAKKAGIW